MLIIVMLIAKSHFANVLMNNDKNKNKKINQLKINTTKLLLDNSNRDKILILFRFFFRYFDNLKLTIRSSDRAVII